MGKEFYKGGPLYLWEINSLERLEVQYCPLELALNSAPQIQTVFVVGRNNPYYFYTAGEDTLTLQLDFHAESANFSDVKDRCNWLRSKRYNNGMQDPPGKFKLVFGKLFDNEIWVMKSCNVRYSQFKNYTQASTNVDGGITAIKTNDYYPSQAYVDIVLGLEGIGTPSNYKNKNIKRNQIFK